MGLTTILAQAAGWAAKLRFKGNADGQETPQVTRLLQRIAELEAEVERLRATRAQLSEMAERPQMAEYNAALNQPAALSNQWAAAARPCPGRR